MRHTTAHAADGPAWPGPASRRAPAPLGAPRQGSFDDLSRPLYDVTFCAVDLETTGGSPRTCEIVEFGAVKSRGGEPQGTFQTLVRPAGDLPVDIQMLTGIAPSMLVGAEPLPVILPSFLEFLGSAVFVAHNARFDWSFIARACQLLDHPLPAVTVIDTARLARRILQRDVPNVKLRTLAHHFRVSHEPCHRAFPDAAACLEVLHALLERAAAYGVVTLAELVELQRLRSGPHYHKVRMTRDVPRTRGVYVFRNARMEPIYVGKATNLRARVRSYFASDERKRMGDLRAEADRVDTIECATELEADALEARLIEAWRPRYNRRGVRRRAPAYLKLTQERHPRFSVTGAIRPDGALYVGPFPSRARAQAAASTLAGLFAIRTCTLRLTARTAIEPCPSYRLGSCPGPCTGRDRDMSLHAQAVARLTSDLHGGLVEASQRLEAKLGQLAARARFEEARAHRDAFADLVRVVDRARMLTALAAAGRMRVETAEGPVLLQDGRLVTDRYPAPAIGLETALALAPDGLVERQAVAAWLARADGARLDCTEHPVAVPWPRPQMPSRIEVPLAPGT